MLASPHLSLEESLGLDGPPDATVQIGGRVYQYFGGSGYFGMQAHPEILAAGCEATLRYGLGTGTTRAQLTAPPVFEVEKKTAGYLGTDQAFYFSCGYLANPMMLKMLLGTFERIFIDEASHGSLFDAAGIVRKEVGRAVAFRHRDSADLKKKLDRSLRPNQRPLVLTDGVFSISGKIAPLGEYDRMLAEYDGASVLIDDAHGFGILGERGCGTLEHFRLQPGRANRTLQDDSQELDFELPEPIFFTDDHTIAANTPVRYYWTATLSKAIGGFGGIIPGSESFVQQLFERSPMIYGASAPPSPVAAATGKALELVFERSGIRKSLQRNTRDLKSRLNRAGFAVEDSPFPIVGLQFGSAHNMRRIQRELAERNILITYHPRSPCVGSEGSLRIAVFATHTPEMLERLIEQLRQVV